MGFFGKILKAVGIGDNGRAAGIAKRDARAAEAKAEAARKQAEQEAAALQKQTEAYQQSMTNMANNARVDLGLNASSTVVAGGVADIAADMFNKKKKPLAAPSSVATQLGINI